MEVFPAVVLLAVYVGLIVYLLTLALRFVQAVEKIANKYDRS